MALGSPVKRLVSSQWCYWVMMETLEAGAHWRKQITKGRLWTVHLVPWPLVSPQPPWCLCLNTGTEMTEPSKQDSNLWSCEPRWSSRVLCHSDGQLRNTYGDVLWPQSASTKTGSYTPAFIGRSVSIGHTTCSGNEFPSERIFVSFWLRASYTLTRYLVTCHKLCICQI